MRERSSRIGALCLGVVLLAATTVRAAHAAVDLRAARLSLPGVSLQDVHLRLGGEAGQPLALTLQARRAAVPALGWHDVGLDWSGQVRRLGRRRWRLDGSVHLQRAPGGLLGHGTLTLLVDVDANTLEVDLAQGASRASAALPLDQPTHAQLRFKDLPLSWLQGLLSRAWSGGRLQRGHVDGQFALDLLDGGIRSSGQFHLRGGGFDSSSGTLAAQGLKADGRVRVDTTGHSARIDVDSTLRGGDVLLGPLYASLPEHAVRLSLTALANAHTVRLRDLRLADPDALQLRGSLELGDDGSLRALRLAHLQVQLPQAYQRYGKAWLSTLGVDQLRSRGGFSARVDLARDGLHGFDFHTDGLDLADGSGRFAVSGLRGGLDWSRHGDRPATTLSWSQLSLYRIVNGAANSHWVSRDGALTLQQPLQVPVLGGQLQLPSLAWRPAAARGQRLDAAVVLTGIHVPALCRALGWPQFKGTLGGAIPALHYAGDRLVLEGGLSLNVFHGFVDVTRLSLQQPFGTAPVLAGDMSLSDLDLGEITSVFDFGRITGRMHGKVAGLRLVDWRPVAFDAQLLADGGGRISQRAVNNLTSVGGGGVAAGLQGAVLKLFNSFGYKRIGLSCRLQGRVCHMSGLKPEDDGYAIVEGRGLPYLNVIGHQTRVSWPTLVSRLKAAIQGGGPVVN